MTTAWNTRLHSQAVEDKLSFLYGADNAAAARIRCETVVEGFAATFGTEAEAIFSAPGRSELGGNHTDHQHGHVLAAAVDIDILAAVRPVDTALVRLLSEGYPMIEVDLNDLTIHSEEVNTTAALIRGVAGRMVALGCAVRGFDAYVTSTVPGGSGLSSSAAFEVLVGTILNELYLDGKFSPVELAQIGQYAENVYFGKPSGLMDQTASSVGGVVAIDFADTAHPVVEQIDLDLRSEGYALCILDSGADHADLTDEYASITDELKAVSGYFGKTVLREVPQDVFLAALPEVRKLAGDRAVLRALHFYGEDGRAVAEAQALKDGDFAQFLAIVRASGSSSAMFLQNVSTTGAVKKQELMVTIALCQTILAGRGAVRVHGGGFGGTAQAFVPLELLDEFKARTEAVLGTGSCHVVSVRPVGGARLA